MRENTKVCVQFNKVLVEMVVSGGNVSLSQAILVKPLNLVRSCPSLQQGMFPPHLVGVH